MQRREQAGVGVDLGEQLRPRELDRQVLGVREVVVVLGQPGGRVEGRALTVHPHLVALGGELDHGARLEPAERCIAPRARELRAHRCVRSLPDHDMAIRMPQDEQRTIVPCPDAASAIMRRMQHRQERVLIETQRHRIAGTLTVAADGYRSRVSDVLNATERDFISLTDVTVELIDIPGRPTQHDFMAISRHHVVFAILDPEAEQRGHFEAAEATSS